MKLRATVAALLTLSLAAACANEDRPRQGGYGHPTGPTDLVLRIETGGGFVPIEYHLTAVPGFSLFGDGRLVRTGAQIEIYPGPALPPLTVTQLTEDAIQAILQAADDAGLLDGDRTLTLDTVADAATTTITVSVDGETHTTSVYALGFEGEERPQGMSEEDWRARRAIADFAGRVGDLSWLPSGSVGEETTFVADELRIFVGPYRGEPDLPQEPIDWPLVGLAAFGDPVEGVDLRCGTVTDGDLTTVMPEAGRANQLTPWRSAGELHAILFRPLLPDESGC
jgi:hypothetical protein